MKRVEIEAQYQPYILKSYCHWTLSLNEKQRYLGRAVVWLMREGNMQRFSGLTPEELQELQHITQEYELVLDLVGWKPDHMNYAMLGNFFHEHCGHGHMHLIPRYDSITAPRVFMGVAFHDDRWGKNYTPETSMQISQEVVLGIVALLKGKLRE